MLRRELISRLRVPPARFVTIDVDGPDPDAAAARHDREAIGLDLAILGLGMNGHVGFNEPGSGPEDGTRGVALAPSSAETATRRRYGASVAPRAGITIGLSRLLEAREVWLLVTGERKARVLRAMDEAEGPDCPASYLRRHPRLTVFADEPAASLLRGR